jgi:predicted nucleic acid-binding protein
MRVLLDTSVLIAAVVEMHEAHARAFVALDRVQRGKDEGVVSAHTLAEMYAILTRAPAPLRHSPAQALLSIEENVLKHFEVLALNATDYAALIREVAMSGVQGGAVYDAILLKAAAKAQVDRVYTLNLKHFLAIATGSLARALAVP